MRISGTAAFAVTLAGSGPATSGSDGGLVSAHVEAYFPGGRVPGAEVVFTVPTYRGGFAAVSAVLDATLSTPEIRVHDPDCGSGFTGRLVGPADGLVGVAGINLTAPSDSVLMMGGPVTLCAAGTPPAQRVGPLVTSPSPFDDLRVTLARPVAPSSLASVSAESGGAKVPISVEQTHPGVVIHAKNGFSLFSTTKIDLSGLRDVLGAPLGLGTVTTALPTAVVTDRTFTAAPPDQAMIGWAGVIDGTLWAGLDELDPEQIALSLGAETGKTKLRLRHRLDCSSGSEPWKLTVVSDEASSDPITLTCTGTKDDVVPLPKGKSFMLIGRRPVGGTRPCWFGGVAPGAAYGLDELAFE